MCTFTEYNRFKSCLSNVGTWADAAELSRRLGFSSRAVRVGFSVSEVALRQFFFSEYMKPLVALLFLKKWT
jgi:hypothetical protein